MSIKWRKIEPKTKIDKLLYQYCTGGFRKAYGEFGDQNVVLPLAYKDIADEIENFEVRDTDVWVVTYPKTGTTWTQEMVRLILNNLDYEKAKVPLNRSYTFLEVQSLYDFDEILKKNPELIEAIKVRASTVDIAKNDQRTPRLIKSHLPWCLLPRAFREETTKAKIVYVIRNPKDTCVSFYHHKQLIDGFGGSLEEFCELFMAGKVYYGQYWNMLDFWERRHNPNILVIKYEDMKRDIRTVIKEVSDFLIGRQFSDDQISSLAEHLSFQNMKDNSYVNYENEIGAHQRLFNCGDKNKKFMRSGTVDNYKMEMSPEMQQRFDEWTKKYAGDTDVSF